ncbi:MAG: hypothetical protein H7707_01215, partial [Acetobacter sp.]|nr:hypothetical protein [Acetobacter sp.]
VGLIAILQGQFSRYEDVIRPFIAVLTVISLLALNLFCQNLAGRNLILLPLVPLISILPAGICAIILDPIETRKILKHFKILANRMIRLKTTND